MGWGIGLRTGEVWGWRPKTQWSSRILGSRIFDLCYQFPGRWFHFHGLRPGGEPGKFLRGTVDPGTQKVRVRLPAIGPWASFPTHLGGGAEKRPVLGGGTRRCRPTHLAPEYHLISKILVNLKLNKIKNKVTCNSKKREPVYRKIGLKNALRAVREK